MNTSKLVNLFLALVVVALVGKIVFFSGDKMNGESGSSGEGIVESIMSRTSIRVYHDRPVEPEKINTLLRAAMSAPSAGNKQPWKFVVITDKETLGSIAKRFRTAQALANAPVAIVVCGDMTNTFPGDGLDYWVEDTSAASENILLAAHGLGLGAVWCGIYPMQERVAYLKELLRLPEHIVPLNVIPVGYPAEDPSPKDKWKPENIHHEMWTEVDGIGLEEKDG